ncbi:hypothetical protein [uncultured Apibacter sp.]|uniref:hypothetical protein n=1 Tax=uncultured Apibacter sp. TaxID=1778616 RepID=UPI0025EB9342|nr:hypothetical protein [uncultured Apibacter sp.]
MSLLPVSSIYSSFDEVGQIKIAFSMFFPSLHLHDTWETSLRGLTVMCLPSSSKSRYIVMIFIFAGLI